MKLMRVGDRGKEIPAILDDENIIRDLSEIIKDFNSDNLNFEVLNKIKKIDLKSLSVIEGDKRIGSSDNSFKIAYPPF